MIESQEWPQLQKVDQTKKYILKSTWFEFMIEVMREIKVLTLIVDNVVLYDVNKLFFS